MIIDYDSKYDSDIELLFEELQDHIVSIDIEKYNKSYEGFGKDYLTKTIQEINKYEGIFRLYIENDHVIGLIVGLINNESINDKDFKVPKRGRITELVVSKKSRSNGIGKSLMVDMESILDSFGCEDILISVFAYNDRALSFYNNNGYHNRMVEMTKKIK